MSYFALFLFSKKFNQFEVKQSTIDALRRHVFLRRLVKELVKAASVKNGGGGRCTRISPPYFIATHQNNAWPLAMCEVRSSSPVWLTVLETVNKGNFNFW
jgi:hypothetical protein